MPFNVTSKPMPLGKLQPTPGDPIRITSMLDAGPPADGSRAYGNTNPLEDLWANKVFIQNVGPQGNIFLGVQGMDKTTMVGVLARIAVGSSYSLEEMLTLNRYHVGDYYIDSDHADAFAIGSADTE